MIPFFPFIHETEKKKEKTERLYIEIEPPPIKRKEQSEEETPRVIVIEL